MIYSQPDNETEAEMGRNRRILKPLLSIPVFYKILIANSLIIFVGATGGTWLAAPASSNPA